MKLLISQLNEGENPFVFSSGEHVWVKDVIHQVEKQGYEVPGEMRLNLNLTKLEPDYYLRGQMDFNVLQTCARCAEGFTLSIHHNFDVALAHVSIVKARSQELAEESEELDVNYFEGNEIDLAPLIQEQFFLSLPYQSLCRPDCKGLCLQCGKTLNRDHAGCGNKEVAPTHPFAALEKLKF